MLSEMKVWGFSLQKSWGMIWYCCFYVLPLQLNLCGLLRKSLSLSYYNLNWALPIKPIRQATIASRDYITTRAAVVLL